MADEELENVLRQIVYGAGKKWKTVLMQPSAKMLKKYPLANEARDYVFRCTQMLDSQKFKYSLVTRIVWTLNHITSFPKCQVCGKPIECWNVPCTNDQYKKTCCKRCERDLAQSQSAQTLSAKYGVSNSFQIPSVKAKIKANHENWLKACNKTRFKHHTFKASYAEEAAYALLKTRKYPDLVRQYHSAEYPFSCDFYVPSQKLYIEYMGSWTHGGHPFDPSSHDDQQKLSIWKQKGTKYYANAIETWTKRDPEKRLYAAQNRIKHLELWSLHDVIDHVSPDDIRLAKMTEKQLTTIFKIDRTQT